jgi:hypothetical protein
VFETIETPSVPAIAGRYFAQLFLCYPATLLIAKPISAILSYFGLNGDYPSKVHFAGYDALICLLVSAVIGSMIGRDSPSLALTGRWIWVVPCVFVVPDILRTEFHRGSVLWLPEYLFQTRSNLGFEVLFFTLPACSAIGYSFGVAILSKRPFSEWRTPKFAAICVGTFSLLVLLMNFIEEAKMARWSRVRSVIGAPGLELARSPYPLCQVPPSGDLLLPAGTMVESLLERRACAGDQLLRADDPGPAQSFVLDKVKVLTGPNAGSEGWVFEYGLTHD